MIFKSFEINNKNFSEQNIFLVYGENEGLKKDIINTISKKKNIEFKQYKFDEEEVNQKSEEIYNLIYSGSLFDKFKIIIINKASDKIYNFIEDIIDKKLQDCLIFINYDSSISIQSLYTCLTLIFLCGGSRLIFSSLHKISSTSFFKIPPGIF